MKRLLCLLLLAPGLTQAHHSESGPQRSASASTSPPWQVFPSPAHGEFIVRLPDAAHPGWYLELVNVLGRVVLQQPLPAAAQVTVPTAGVPTGLYWVRLRGPQGYQAIQRVVLS